LIIDTVIYFREINFFYVVDIDRITSEILFDSSINQSLYSQGDIILALEGLEV
jgi:hypothetical protein